MNIKFLTYILFFCCFSNINAQNIFDYENSLKYAEYLYSTNQYELAAQEYERIVFLDSQNISPKEKLVLSYFKSRKTDFVLDKINILFPDSYTHSPQISNIYLYCLFYNDSINEYKKYLRQTGFSSYKKELFLTAAYILEEKYDSASLCITRHSTNFDTSFMMLNKILTHELNKSKKSKFVGGIMSAIIPGTGKFYTHDYYDGFVSMSIVGLNLWQARRAYLKSGPSSPYTIGFSIMSTAFYVGGIYGAVQSVERYNTRMKTQKKAALLNIILFF